MSPPALAVTCRFPPVRNLFWKALFTRMKWLKKAPLADHTGYYNEVEQFPVFTVERITHRKDPIYHSTYTGRPPDEPAILGVALNEVFVPILKKQFPEITDFYLPPEGCSYRMAGRDHEEAIPRPRQAGDDGVWSFLPPVYVHQVCDCYRRRCEMPETGMM